MKIVFKTDSSFLNKNFPQVRSRLVGFVEEVQKRAAAPDKSSDFPLKKKLSKESLKLVNIALSLVMVFSLVATLFLLTPTVYYQFFPADVIEIDASESGTARGGEFEQEEVPVETEKPAYVPPRDENLPEGDWLIIPRIGVRTQPQATQNPEDALDTGVWQVPDFGVAGDRTMPMILAAHRFGWEWWWQSDYWKYHSFYELPETEPGDIIEVISDQRKWIYEIYAGEEGEQITDYDADLILYTCKFLKSPIRHFRYARLIDPTVDTQL